MERALQFAKFSACVAIACFFFVGASALIVLRSAVAHTDRSLVDTREQLAIVLNHVDQAAQESVHVSRDTRINLVHFDRNQQAITRDIRSLVTRASIAVEHTDYAMNDAHTGLIPSASTAVLVASKSVSDITENALPVIQHTDDLINSPAVKSVLSHADASAAHLDHSMAHVEGILEDGHIKADKFTHPSRKQQVWNHFKEGFSMAALLLRSLL